MADDQNPIEPGGNDAEATSALRRKLLKAGGAAVPVMVSLQSGTAWAVSSCASTINRPTQSAMDSVFDTAPPNGNRDTVNSITGISNTLINNAIDSSFTAATGTYPETSGDGSVQSAEVMHLLVTNGSCWVSFCDGPVDIGGVNVTGPGGGSACDGS